MDAIIDRALAYTKELFRGDASGHDYYHTLRVYNMAMRLAQAEGADITITALAAILHDADDAKLFSGGGLPHARAFLGEHPKAGAILEAISTVSYKGTGTIKPKTIEGMVVQDADRLDAIGAIGIARTFAYGGSNARAMHDPEVHPRGEITETEYRASTSTSINHFYEKLLKLKELMNTRAGREIAEARDMFMRAYLDEFLAEWDGRA